MRKNDNSLLGLHQMQKSLNVWWFYLFRTRIYDRYTRSVWNFSWWWWKRKCFSSNRKLPSGWGIRLQYPGGKCTVPAKTKCDHSLHLPILDFGSVSSVSHLERTVGLWTKVLNRKKSFLTSAQGLRCDLMHLKLFLDIKKKTAICLKYYVEFLKCDRNNSQNKKRYFTGKLANRNYMKIKKWTFSCKIISFTL